MKVTPLRLRLACSTAAQPLGHVSSDAMDKKPARLAVRPRSERGQRGITLIGLVFWGVIVAMVALVAMRVMPTMNEYFTIQRTVNRIAQEGATTVPEIRKAFDRQKDIEYSISSISGKDLSVTKENDKVVISFAYPKEIELFDPVYLLIKYEGRSR